MTSVVDMPSETSELESDMPIESVDEALADPNVVEATQRRIIRIADRRITYALNQERSYIWDDPEERVRATCVAWLIISRDYPANRIRTEVPVPRRTTSDFADIVVYRDDACRDPYLVVENKAADQSDRDRVQAIEQAFGNTNSLGAPLALYDESGTSILFDRSDFAPGEREVNRLGTREV